jgi:hypothetical protein
MRWGVLPALFLAAQASAEIQVHVSNGRVDLQATGAPLSDVLERLAKQTGMKVTYDGAPQRTPVNLTLTNRTPAETVLGVLDGLGLNYAFRMDATGTRIEALLIAGTAPTAPAGGLAALPQQRAAPAYRPPEPVVQDEEEAQPADEDVDSDADAADVAPDPLPGGPAPLPAGTLPPGTSVLTNGQAPPSRAFGPGVLGTATRPEFPSQLPAPVPPFLGSQPPATQPPASAPPETDDSNP